MTALKNGSCCSVTYLVVMATNVAGTNSPRLLAKKNRRTGRPHSWSCNSDRAPVHSRPPSAPHTLPSGPSKASFRDAQTQA